MVHRVKRFGLDPKVAVERAIVFCIIKYYCCVLHKKVYVKLRVFPRYKNSYFEYQY